MTDDDDRLHRLFAPLREQVVKVSVDFGRRVAEGIEHFLKERETRSPSLLDVFGDLLLESINLATHAAASSDEATSEPTDAAAGEDGAAPEDSPGSGRSGAGDA